MSDTPRTDMKEKFGVTSDGCDYVHMDFARQLERELTAARAATDRLRGELGELVVIARENWSSHEYLMSNPPKHIVVYRMYEIAKRALAEGEA